VTDQEDYEHTIYDQENDPDWPDPNPEPDEEPSHPEEIPDADTAAETNPDPKS
jgi:hypothetical protein